MTNQEKMAQAKAAYIAQVGHNRSFLQVIYQGKPCLVLNNTLHNMEDAKDSWQEIDGDTINSLELAQEDTIENRLDNLAKVTVLKSIPTEIMLHTAVCIMLTMGIDPKSEQGNKLLDGIPDRIMEQPNATIYMLSEMLGMRAEK